MCAWRLMLASFNFHPCWSKVACKHTYTSECLSMESKDERRTKFKCTAFECRLNSLYTRVILTKAISSFRFGLSDRVF